MTFEEELYYDEKGLEALYAEFAAKLKKYIEEMQGNIASLGSIISDLGHFWSGEDYENFRRGMQQGVNQTDNQVQRVEDLKREIELARAESAAALERMRVKYGFE